MQPRIPAERQRRLVILAEVAVGNVVGLQHELQLDVEMITGKEPDQVAKGLSGGDGWPREAGAGPAGILRVAT